MIRDATVNDAARLAKIHVASWQSAYPELIPAGYLDGLSGEYESRTQGWAAVLRQNSSNDVVLVAESGDGRVVGFAHAGPGRDADLGPAVGELYSMYLDPDVFRSGYGTRLIAELVSRMRAAGYRRLSLWVMSENWGARAFYERFGWEFDGTEADQCLGLTVPAIRYQIAG